jgi:hypothetical protein
MKILPSLKILSSPVETPRARALLGIGITHPMPVWKAQLVSAHCGPEAHFVHSPDEMVDKITVWLQVFQTMRGMIVAWIAVQIRPKIPKILDIPSMARNNP